MCLLKEFIYRKQKDIKLNDFINRLMELQQTKIKNPAELKHLSHDIIIAQGVIFFIAGFETTANTLSTLCYNLAKYPQVQVLVI